MHMSVSYVHYFTHVANYIVLYIAKAYIYRFCEHVYSYVVDTHPFVLFCSSYQQCSSKSLHILPLSELEKRAFLRCSVIITEKLNISAILPHLNAQEMLTMDDYQTLTNKYITDTKKIEHLIYELPRKGNDFFGKFMFCLCESKCGTGHGDIVKALTQCKAKLEKDNERTDTSDVQEADEENKN